MSYIVDVTITNPADRLYTDTLIYGPYETYDEASALKRSFENQLAATDDWPEDDDCEPIISSRCKVRRLLDAEDAARFIKTAVRTAQTLAVTDDPNA